jgi:hypothetical protein
LHSTVNDPRLILEGITPLPFATPSNNFRGIAIHTLSDLA